MGCPDNEISFGYKRERNTNMHSNKMNSERNSNKGPCIPLIWNIQDRQVHRERKQFGVCLRLEEWGNWGVMGRKCGFLSGGNNNVLKF